MVVCGILGPSYSSSTAIGYLLGGSEECFFVSEFWRVFESPVDKVFCIFHGDECTFWTKNTIQEFRRIGSMGAYTLLEEKVGDQLIVDSGKRPSFFSQALSSNEHIAFFLEAQKHPLRFLASYFYNDFLEKEYREVWETKSLDEIGQMNELQNAFVCDGAEKVLEDILSRYENGRRFCQTENAEWCGVKHEFLTDTVYLEKLGQWISDRARKDISLDGSKFAYDGMHPIGGNMAPSWIARRDKLGEAKSGRKRYYSGVSGVTIDNKADLLFSRETQNTLSRLPLFSDLVRFLGY